MAPPRVTHDYVSANGDPPDPTLIGQTKWNADHRIEGLGSAAELDAGTSAGNVIALDNDGKLPAVDGSQLTNIPTSGLAAVIDDPAPKLGADLDLNGHSIPGIDYGSLSNKPTLGTAAAENVTAFATASQGSKADTAVQPGSLAVVATSGAYSDLTGKPTLGSAASHSASDFATAAQGAKADSALQSFDVAAAVHAATGKSTPVDADELGLVDSAASNVLKKLTWVNLKAALKAAFAWREVLTANRTYYVRSDGSDSNNGLANTSGGAFKTTQKAMDVVASLDISIYNATIQYGDTGPFAGCVLKAPLGSGTVIITGDPANPSSYTITKAGSSAYIFDGRSAVGNFQISGVHPHDATANYHFVSGVPGNILTLTNNDYGDVINYMCAATGGKVIITGANNKVSCSTSFTAFFLGDYHGYLFAPGATTFTWTRNTTQTTGFAYARQLGIVQPFNMTFNLAGFTATGPRFNVTDNASIVTGGGGASFLPGTSAGSQTNGGLYN